MKRSILVLLCAAVLLCSASCGGDRPAESGAASETGPGTQSESGSPSQEGSRMEESAADIELAVDSCLCREVDRTLKAENVFLDRKYKVGRSPESSKPDPYGEKLTNGWAHCICQPRNTVAFAGASPMNIDFDMGDEEREIADIRVHCHRTLQYGYGLPAFVSVKVSDDGKRFTEIGKVNTPSDLDDCCVYEYYFAFPKAFIARYVRIYFGTNESEQLCVDEIAAYEYREDGVLENLPGIEEDQTYCIKDFYSYSLNLGESGVQVGRDDEDYDVVQNLARLEGVDFQIQHFDPLYPGHENTGKDRIGLLTDGVLHGGDEERDYFKFHRGGGRNVVCDLGAVMAVRGCKLAFLDRYTWGITTPVVYYISISEDGENWVTVFAEHNPDYGKTMRQQDDRVCDFGGEYKARYVKLSFTTVPDNSVSAFVYLGEWEITGRKNAENAASAEYDKTIVYGNYPDRADWGFHNILFTCVADEYGRHCTDIHVLNEETAYGYAVAETEEGCVPLMDSFMFTTRGPMNSYSDRGKGFAFFLDELFYEDLNVNAVEKAAPRINAALGRTGKIPVWISVNCPALGDTFNGEKLDSAESFVECLKWQADEAIKRFSAQDYNNVYLVGFYWQHENIRKDSFDAEAASAFNEYIHSLGYRSIWCPYYTADGLFNAHYYGFDVTCLQPNYMFSKSLPGRVDSAAEIAKIYGLGIEIEVENLYQSREALEYYRKYLRGGVDHGYINSVNVYYQGSIPGTYINCVKRGGGICGAMFGETVAYANGTLGKDYAVPVKADLSVYSDASLVCEGGGGSSVELGGLYGVRYRYFVTPAYGAVRLDESGKLTYSPAKGFRGSDEVRILLFDNVGEYKIITVSVTVE